LYGFIACGPYEVLPEWVFDKVFCPSVETDPITGEAKVAQIGLRRIESSLIQGGYKREEVFIGHPDMLHKSIGPDTKVVGINVWILLEWHQLPQQCHQKNYPMLQ